MIQRILTLSAYFLRSLLFSLTGLLYILLALAFYRIFFDPTQQTPDLDYFILILGALGLSLTFLVTLTVASRANQAVHFPLVVRLPSRGEYLAAVFVAALAFVALLQSVIALLAFFINGPDFDLIALLSIPPLWTSANVLAAVLALHASDLVTASWSRVYVFGLLAALLYGQSGVGPLGGWLSGLLNRLGNSFLSRGWVQLSSPTFSVSNWVSGAGSDGIERLLGLVFWPLDAIAEATVRGSFTRIQALAPAVLLIYATILFVLAASFLASKDLFLSE